MARTIEEWIGRNDDAMPPRTVFDRLWALQGGKDAITGIAFGSKDKIVRDHKVPLIDGGQNRESNLQLITDGTHKLKTAVEADGRAKERRVRAKDRGYVTGQPKPKIQSPGFRRQPSNTREIYDDLPPELRPMRQTSRNT